MNIRSFFPSLLLSLCLLAALPLRAQDFENSSPGRTQVHTTDISKLSPLEILEDSLVFFADSMYSSPIPESRAEGNEQFIRVMKKFLKMPESFTAENKKLSEKIAILTAPDQAFRIYNWEVIQSSELGRYYGVIQMQDGRLFPLIDVSDKIIRGAEDSTFSGTRWFGSLYYNIVMKEMGGQKIYFLLGWNGNSLNSERKIVEAFGFNSLGQAQFGAPLFNVIERGKRRNTNRFVLEYQRGARVSLNIDKDNGQIMMDHCESQIGDPAKKYTYIPDGTYDGLSWDGSKWNMSENVMDIQDLKQGNAPVDKPIK
jgi:hypothetical protein